PLATPPGTRLPRRTRADRDALLRQQREPEVRKEVGRGRGTFCFFLQSFVPRSSAGKIKMPPFLCLLLGLLDGAREERVDRDEGSGAIDAAEAQDPGGTALDARRAPHAL